MKLHKFTNFIENNNNTITKQQKRKTMRSEQTGIPVWENRFIKPHAFLFVIKLQQYITNRQ